MDARELLLEQTRHHYDFLGHAIAGLDVEQARSSNGDRPSIAWQLGHTTRNADSVAEAVGGIALAGFPERSSEAHWGVADTAGWSALTDAWDEVSERTLASLEALDEAALETPPAVAIHPSFADRLTTRRAFWSGHVFHVAYHLGQVGRLRAELGLGWAG